MKFFKFIFSLLFICLAANVCAQQHNYPHRDLQKYCLSSFEKNGVCPTDMCRFVCIEGSLDQGCPLTCGAKDCLELSAKDCPLETCQLLDGCQKDQKVCYPKIEENESECGGVAYTGQKSCCEGFIKRCGIEFFDGTCDMIGAKSTSSIPMCLPCGNGICNQFENRCNCPEDCGSPA